MPNETFVTLDRKLWLTEGHDRLVEHGDPEARVLFGIAGRRVSAAECKRLGYKPNKKLAADDETAQVVRSDAEKAEANDRADQDEMDRLARASEEADSQAKEAIEKVNAADKARRAQEAKMEKKLKAAAEKEAKQLADKERKAADNKGGNKTIWPAESVRSKKAPRKKGGR